jgi:hypothetical protein
MKAHNPRIVCNDRNIHMQNRHPSYSVICPATDKPVIQSLLKRA